MDLWFGICIAFMSVAILEYAFLLKIKMDLDTSTKQEMSLNGKRVTDMRTREKKKAVKTIGFRMWAKRIDKLFLFISLAGYLLVTMIYSIVYLGHS